MKDVCTEHCSLDARVYWVSPCSAPDASRLSSLSITSLRRLLGLCIIRGVALDLGEGHAELLVRRVELLPLLRARPGANPDYNPRSPYIYYSSTFVPAYVSSRAFDL